MSWWIDTPDFYAEAARRARQRVNKPEKASKGWEAPRKNAERLQREAAILPTEVRLCALETCRKPFSLNLRGPQRIYCSQICNKRAWKRRQRQRRGQAA